LRRRSIRPFGYSCQQAGGDRPHEHKGIDCHVRNSHHHYFISSEVADCYPEITDCVSHIHILWFGFHLTHPSPIDSKGSDSGSREGAGTAFVQSLSEADFVVSMRNVVTALLQFVGDDPGSGHKIIESARGRFSSMPATVAPLCDTARHERSGVQLF
jgi:hypothetical protein